MNYLTIFDNSSGYKTYPGPGGKRTSSGHISNGGMANGGMKNGGMTNGGYSNGGGALNGGGNVNGGGVILNGGLLKRELPEPPTLPPPDYNETMAARNKVINQLIMDQ